MFRHSGRTLPLLVAFVCTLGSGLIQEASAGKADWAREWIEALRLRRDPSAWGKVQQRFEETFPPERRLATILDLCRKAERMQEPEASLLREAMLCYVGRSRQWQPNWNLEIEKYTQACLKSTNEHVRWAAKGTLLRKAPARNIGLIAELLNGPSTPIRTSVPEWVFMYSKDREAILQKFVRGAEERGDVSREVGIAKRLLQKIAAGEAPPVPSPTPPPAASAKPSNPSVPPVPVPSSGFCWHLPLGIGVAVLLVLALAALIFRRRRA